MARERHVAPVPRRQKDLALIVGVNQSDEISEHDAMLVPQSGPGKDDGSEGRVGEMDRNAGGNERGVPRLERERCIEACAQIESRGAARCVMRQLSAQTRVENLDVECFHDRRLGLRAPGCGRLARAVQL